MTRRECRSNRFSERKGETETFFFFSPYLFEQSFLSPNSLNSLQSWLSVFSAAQRTPITTTPSFMVRPAVTPTLTPSQGRRRSPQWCPRPAVCPLTAWWALPWTWAEARSSPAAALISSTGAWTAVITPRRPPALHPQWYVPPFFLHLI